MRERFAEETPRIVIVCDRRPEMSLFPRETPWLHKPEALAYTVEVIVASALNQRGLVGYLDHGGHDGENEPGTPFWRSPRGQSSVWATDVVEATRGYLGSAFDAPSDSVERSLHFLAVVGGAVPTGSFVFVLSDFLEPPTYGAWTGVADRGWDIVPIVIQDPLWEQSFPPLAGAVVPLTDTARSRLLHVNLTRREARGRAVKHERRLAALLADLVRFGLDPVLVSSSERDDVRRTLLGVGRAEVRAARTRSMRRPASRELGGPARARRRGRRDRAPPRGVRPALVATAERTYAPSRVDGADGRRARDVALR